MKSGFQVECQDVSGVTGSTAKIYNKNRQLQSIVTSTQLNFLKRKLSIDFVEKTYHYRISVATVVFFVIFFNGQWNDTGCW